MLDENWLFSKKKKKKMPYESAAIFGVITSEKSF